jgi:UDP-glucose:(heptosyl)LPS alpha-1,3-glucosyltransferase
VKLAFCLFKYFRYGGLERDFLRIALLSQARGHEITVFTQEWQGDSPAGFQVHVLRLRRLTSHGRAAEFADACAHWLDQDQFERVIGFNKMPGLDFYYAADPCFQHRKRERFGVLYKLNPRYRTFVALEEAVFSRRSRTHIMLLSPSSQQIFTRYYHTQPERFHVMPPNVAPDRIPPPNAAQIRAQFRHEFDVTTEHKLLLFIGSVYPVKGLDRALIAMAALPSAVREKTRLIVLGEDDPRPYLAQARRLRLGSQVSILGGRDDVPRFLLGADLLIHPARSEVTGTVLLEALVSGLSVLTTEVCGFAHHVIQADAGRVAASPFDQTEFNRLLAEMLTSDKHHAWRANALNYAHTTDLYSLPQKAVELIERGAR